jgi:AcrR family transcriptional regulator
MPSTATGRPAKRSEARERLLATASGLFYAEGINKVGVDRIVSASNVTLATFYRHFPRKQDLVVAYLNAAHNLEAQRMEALAERAIGRELLRAVGDDIIGMIGSPDFRGCAFINAAAEAPAGSAEELATKDFRTWLHELFATLVAEAGYPNGDRLTVQLVLLYDGANIAAQMDHNPAAALAAREAAGELLSAAA